MASVKDVFEFLDGFAPTGTKMDFDNVGILAGFPEKEVKKVLISLDITEKVIEEAENMGAELIVSHHPLIFTPLKRVIATEPEGARLIKLLRAGISAVCMHTNLDCAEGGVNDALAEAVGITAPFLPLEKFSSPQYGEYSLGRYGKLEKGMAMREFLPLVKERLKTKGLRYYDAGREVKNVAVVGGSGGSLLELVDSLGCDTLITADVKYDVFLSAVEYGVNIIDADHFCTENVVVKVLCDRLRGNFSELEIAVSKAHHQIIDFC